MSVRGVSVAALCACSALGCSSDQLIFTTFTKIGIDMSTAQGQPVEGVFGYKRFEGAIVPVDAQQKESAPAPPAGGLALVSAGADGAQGGAPPAHSIFAGLCIRNNWFDIKVAQVFATGQAADEIASGKSSNKPTGEVLKCQ